MKAGKAKFKESKRRQVRRALKNSDITQLGNTQPYKIGHGIGLNSKLINDKYSFDVV